MQRNARSDQLGQRRLLCRPISVNRSHGDEIVIASCCMTPCVAFASERHDTHVLRMVAKGG